ncbi:MAG: 16S rRNA (guanine(527)-N(7))-methyltransferase RsmG [Dehalococcoidia bacterium]|nr:MAG: 16S rRNA (guanine(527)-N(7))-methyltransferase RsmG [Dehalococcoidia bacterium]
MERLISGAGRLGLQLSPGQVEQFEVYYRELVNWNRRINLTAITGYEEVQIKHFLDSLAVTLALKPGDKSFRLIDVGSGAGLPGIPLKIIMPDIKLTLLEATAKKAAFLDHISQKLGLKDVAVVVGRAEDIAHREQYREQFDIVLSRAVAPLVSLVELTLPFCAIGGCFIAQKKGAVDPELSQATGAVGRLGGKLRERKRIELAEFSGKRWLIVIDKVSPTPETYPRRAGIPQKRPLLDKQAKQ